MSHSRRFLLAALAVAACGPVPAQEPSADGFPLPPGAVRRFGNRQMRHPEGVIAAAVSPDGKLLATASRGAVIVWDLKTLSAKRVLTGARFYDYGVVGHGTSLAFLPDSKALLVALRPQDFGGKVALGGDTEVAQVWDLDTGQVRYTLRGTMSYYNAVWLAAGGKEVVSLRDELAVVFYDAKDGKELRRFTLPQQLAYPVASGDGETFAHVPGRDRGLAVVRTRDGKEVYRVPGGTVLQTALSHDGRVLVYLDDQKKVRAHDLKADKGIAEFTHPGEQFNTPLRLSADGKTLYFGSQQGHLYRWDLTTNKPIPGLGRHSLWTLTGLAVSPDESTLFTMGHNKAIRRWDLKTGKEYPLPPGYQTQAFFELSADGKRLFIGDHATQLDEWDLATGKKVRALSPEGNGGVNALAASPDGKWLAAGRVVQDVQLWDLAAGKVVKELLPAEKPDRFGGDQVSRVAFRPDSQVVFGMSPLTGLTAWEVPAGKKLWNVPGKAPLLAVDPKGQFLITAGGYDNPPAPWTVLDAKTGGVVAHVTVPVEPVDPRRARRQAVPYTTSVAFTADGRWVVSGHYDGTVRVWEAGSWREVRKLAVADQGPGQVAASADGRWLAVGGSEARVSVWELATGKPVARFEGHQSWVTQVAFTPDGRGLLSNADLAPVLWDLAPADLPKDGLWEALASDDGAKAYRAQWALVRDPKAAVALLTDQMKATELAVPREQFDRWVAGLDSPQFRVREASEKALVAGGSKVPVGWLRKALADSRADEPRARLTRVLSQREKEPDPVAWRVSRAVQALELAGTEEARGLLKKWAATGTPLADEAGEALGRLKK